MIARRRDGKVHTRAEFDFLCAGATTGAIPDYQLSAWLMAAVLRPLSLDETAELTMAMAESGERLDLSRLPKPWVDKHSTGGVGDKTTIVLLPLLASCGLTMVKMSGRGLGITGGTIDKLASVPGFRTDLSPEEMVAQAERIGVALTGQTPRLAPADKALYALRDATGTVASMPLIASSILSKKLAGGAETIVIDLKCGSGAFMKSLEEARRLADLMLEVARRCEVKLVVAITDMDQPLGSAVGNALEVAEALDTLSGRNPEGRFAQLCLSLAGIALWASGKVSTAQDAAPIAEAALREGRALAKASDWFAAQGATLNLQEGGHALLAACSAPVRRDVIHREGSRFVQRIDAAAVGDLVVGLGGGRRRKDDAIDPAVGIELAIEVGSHLVNGVRLATLHARSEADAEAAEAILRRSIEAVEEPVIPERSALWELVS